MMIDVQPGDHVRYIGTADDTEVLEVDPGYDWELPGDFDRKYLLPDRDRRSDPDAYDRWNLNAARVMHAHDVYLMLMELRAADPAKADGCATRIVEAALAGDSYGEWAWQWAEDEGLDAQSIADEARAAVEPEREPKP